MTAATVLPYLHQRELITDPRICTVTELSGGVSGCVFLVESKTLRLVLKQALPQLRTAQRWCAKPERALTEAAALDRLHEITPAHTPQLLDVDPAWMAFTMTAADPSWPTWKHVLLTSIVEPARTEAAATALGTILGHWHHATWGDSLIASEFQDYVAFEQLRITPFHRAIRLRHPQLGSAIDRCIDELTTVRQCLVHGDFSPKNILVGEHGLWVLDFEVAHFGAAVFDLAFVTAHLMLKAIHRPEHASTLRAACAALLTAHTDVLGKDMTTLLGPHTACVMLSRVDGTSPVDYLTHAEQKRCRRIATAVLSVDTSTIEDAWDLAAARTN